MARKPRSHVRIFYISSVGYSRADLYQIFGRELPVDNSFVLKLSIIAKHETMSLFTDPPWIGYIFGFFIANGEFLFV